MREHCLLPAKEICNALLEYVSNGRPSRQIGEKDRMTTKQFSSSSGLTEI